MLVLVDQDGVIADTERHILNVWRAKYPNEPYIALEDRVGWEISLQYPEHLRNHFWKLWHEPGFFRTIPPMPGAIDAMFAMKEAGLTVRICTAPMQHHDTCAQEKVQWVREHLGNEFTHEMVITRDKTLIHGDVLIDDRPDADSAGIRTPAWEHLLFDTPCNRHVEGKRRFQWDRWREFIKVPTKKVSEKCW